MQKSKWFIVRYDIEMDTERKITDEQEPEEMEALMALPEEIDHLRDSGLWRVADDDGVIYAHGRCRHNGGEEMFRPLDALQGGWGVPIIQYHINGHWVTI